MMVKVKKMLMITMMMNQKESEQGDGRCETER